MGNGKNGWWGNRRSQKEEIQDEQNGKDMENKGNPERVYRQDELFDMAYKSYRKESTTEDVMSRRAFREDVWWNAAVIKGYLRKEEYRAYLSLMGDNARNVPEDDVVRDAYVPEDNPDASDEAYEVKLMEESEGIKSLAGDVQNILKRDEVDRSLPPEPNYRTDFDEPECEEETESMGKNEELQTDDSGDQGMGENEADASGDTSDVMDGEEGVMTADEPVQPIEVDTDRDDQISDSFGRSLEHLINTYADTAAAPEENVWGEQKEEGAVEKNVIESEIEDPIPVDEADKRDSWSENPLRGWIETDARTDSAGQQSNEVKEPLDESVMVEESEEMNEGDCLSEISHPKSAEEEETSSEVNEIRDDANETEEILTGAEAGAQEEPLTGEVPDEKSNESAEDVSRTADAGTDLESGAAEKTSFETTGIRQTDEKCMPEHEQDEKSRVVEGKNKEENMLNRENVVEEVRTGDMTAADISYIFGNKEVVALLRKSIYCDPEDSSRDSDLKDLSIDEIFEQLLRVGGVNKNIPYIVKTVKDVYLHQIEEMEDGISHKRQKELLLAMIEQIRKLSRYEYGDDFNAYLEREVGLDSGECAKIGVKEGPGGKKAITLEIAGEGINEVYELTGVSFMDVMRVMNKFEQCSVGERDVDILAFLHCFGITTKRAERRDNKATFFYDKKKHFVKKQKVEL